VLAKHHLKWLIVDHGGEALEDQVGSLPATAIPVDGSCSGQFPSEWFQAIYGGIPVCTVVGSLKDLQVK
jgi:hypothetical protein